MYDSELIFLKNQVSGFCTYPMLTSLKVVNMAVVFWASLSLDATVLRILDILTRVSALVPVIWVGSAVAIVVALNGVTGTAEICVTEAGAFGIAGTFGKVVGVATGVATVTGAAGVGAGAAAGLAAAGLAGAPAPPSVTLTTAWFGPMVLPSSTSHSSMTPADGERTSIVVLSVSTLAMHSSASTESPT